MKLSHIGNDRQALRGIANDCTNRRKKGRPICRGVRYSGALRCKTWVAASAPGEKGSFLTKVQYGRDQRRTCPPSGCEPRFARFAPTPEPNRSSPPRPASALCLRGSCALWAVRTCSGGGSHWPPGVAQYAPAQTRVLSGSHRPPLRGRQSLSVVVHRARPSPKDEARLRSMPCNWMGIRWPVVLATRTAVTSSQYLCLLDGVPHVPDARTLRALKQRSAQGRLGAQAIFDPLASRCSSAVTFHAAVRLWVPASSAPAHGKFLLSLTQTSSRYRAQLQLHCESWVPRPTKLTLNPQVFSLKS